LYSFAKYNKTVEQSLYSLFLGFIQQSKCLKSTRDGLSDDLDHKDKNWHIKIISRWKCFRDSSFRLVRTFSFLKRVG